MKRLTLFTFMIFLCSAFVSAGVLDHDTGLISYYQLDQLSGDVIDQKGVNDGTVNGVVGRGVSGKVDNAFSFDGTDAGYVSMTTTDLPSGSAERTISFWINPDYQLEQFKGIYSYRGGILGMGSASTHQLFDILIDHNDPDSGDFRIVVDGFDAGGGSAYVGNFNEWNHVAVVLNSDGQTIDFYINGAKYTVVSGNTFNTNYGVFEMGRARYDGASPVPQHYYNGLLDEVAVWDRALTETEVLDLYNNPDNQGGETIPEVSSSALVILLAVVVALVAIFTVKKK